jgi:transposase
MPYISGKDRNQVMLCTMESFVPEHSIARAIDAFVDGLDMDALGVTKSKAAFEGRPSYDPRCLLKLFLYGQQHAIRSSRKLQEACSLNVEVRWLLGGLTPDFRTISDFRKENVKVLPKVFHEFNKKVVSSIETGFIAIDGSKIQALNAKDRNFTANKLDDRISWLDAHCAEYLRQIKDADERDDDLENGTVSKEEIERKLKEAQERLAKYQEYRKFMEDNGLSQLSLTDADAKLMKNKNGFAVAYNVQTAVDSESHLIRDFQMTNQPTDHGLMESTAESVLKENEELGKSSVIDATADKGYNQVEDMAHCLEKGIIPHVILPDGQDTYTLELPYQENSIGSTKPGDVLKGGQIPEEYKDVIDKISVKTKRKFVKDESAEAETSSPYMSKDAMIERAAEGYFVRDPEANVVYCPMGEQLRQKCIKKNGNVRYANKTACRHCKFRNKCFSGKGEWKEIDFNKDTLEKPNKTWLSGNGTSETQSTEKSEQKPVPRKGHFEVRKVVEFILRPKRELMNKRLCLSEHPFGTIKRTMNGGYFLLKGMEKVTGEFALLGTGYNMRVAYNLLGFQRLMQLMR